MIDDDDSILRLVDALLSEEGYEVTCAQHGVAGLEALEQCDPSLVVLDLAMPRMDGYEFAEAARDAGLTAPFLVVTATAPPRGEIDAERIIQKPFDPDDLVRVVNRLVVRDGR